MKVEHANTKGQSLELAFLIRACEEKLLDLFAQGLVHGTIHTCIGQEFSAVALKESIRAGDFIFSNHRGHGHYLAMTGDLHGLIAEILGREGGSVGGIGGSQHLRNGHFFANGVQGGLIPVAAGSAWAHQLQKNQNISVVFFGDGTLGEGVLYETLNIAAKWGLPLLFVLEDNGIAQSTPKEDTFAGSLQNRVEGFGVPYSCGETADWNALEVLFRTTVADIRRQSRPHFIHLQTSRLKAHSKGDDTRTQELIQKLEQADPLNRLLTHQDPDALAAQHRGRETVEQALQEILARPPAQKKSAPQQPINPWQAYQSSLGGNYRKLLNQAFLELMDKHDHTLFLGEDVIDPYGGCFKVSQQLSERFRERVRSTPISEAAIAGLGTGASLAGRASFVEFMFADFSFLAFDQMANQAAKLAALDSRDAPQVFFRTPTGGGRGYGPTHSQNIEKYFLGIPGFDVYSLNCLIEPLSFLSHLITTKLGPALICENKILYTQDFQQTDKWDATINTATFDIWLEPPQASTDMIVVTSGAYVDVALRAAQKFADEFGRHFAILAVCKLSRYLANRDEKRWRKYQKCLLFEEGPGYASFSAELAAQLSSLGLQTWRWQAPDEVVPAAPTLESRFRLTPEQLIAELLEMS